MTAFDHISLIYNPNSTGDAPQIAKELSKKILKNKIITVKPTLTPTKYAGHAMELAKKISTKHKRPLIISISGDGGYNEIVNGAMQAKEKSSAARPVVVVVGAGNANDHKRVMRGDDNPLVPLIAKANAKPIDLIKIDIVGAGFKLSRYAHSYIGLGITPEVAVELNKNDLDIFQEIRIVVKSFLKYRPFTVEYEGKKREVDSLIFANINEMAKVLKLNHKRNITDDQFEVIEFPHRNKFYLLYMMMLAAFKGLRHQPQYSSYSFKTFDSHPLQLDGEIEKMPKRADVTVSSIAAAIESLY